jgi:hypothetical protein
MHGKQMVYKERRVGLPSLQLRGSGEAMSGSLQISCLNLLAEMQSLKEFSYRHKISVGESSTEDRANFLIP